MSNEFEIDNIEDKFSTNNEEGKRSPTSLIPVLQIILLASVQLYFAAPIVACGKCLHFLSTAPSMTCLAACALLELFLLYMLSCYYMVGELSPEVINWFRNIGDDMRQLMMVTMRT